MRYFALFTACLICAIKTQAQDTIRLANPSFEDDAPTCGHMPASWINRGDLAEAAPSVQPGCWDVNTPAFHGRQYISLVTRKNQNCDKIGQKLKEDQWLTLNSTYRIRLYLANSETMEMQNDRKTQSAPFVRYIMLRLWGYNNQLKKKELLAQTPEIDHQDWRRYELVFTPATGDFDEVQLEACFLETRTFAYNGNVLIDSISAITKSREGNVDLGRLGPAIPLSNPSFEDTPRCCETPKAWYNCGGAEESPPDIQPGSFQVNLKPHSGKSYLGLVVRDNETWESISQHLTVPWKSGQVYGMKVFLARSESLLSLSRSSGEEIYYNTPVKLRVWGGLRYCDRLELLGETPPVIAHNWKEFKLALNPHNPIDYLTLEAYYDTPVLSPYNGNLLVDDVSLYHLEK